MIRVYLSLGSNMGRRKSNLDKAIRLLIADVGDITRVSSVYETEPWGCDSMQNFYNQVVEIITFIEPFALLSTLHELEKAMGRKPSHEHYAPRPIDMDILFYENRIITSEDLKIPHPLIQSRRFVLTPLSEIAPDFRHPVLGKTVSQLLDRCRDDMKVTRITS